MTEGRDRPRLSDNQTLLSPVVLAGPPRLSFKKPVVLSFGHCVAATTADAEAASEWELGLYHCDSLFSEQDDTPWMKLATLSGSPTDSPEPVLAHMESDSCQVMTQFLSRFCIVGQSADPTAAKLLRLLVFGRTAVTTTGSSETASSSEGSHNSLAVCVSAVDDTKAAVELAVREAGSRQGLTLLAESPKPIKLQDQPGSSLAITATECTTGWSLRRSGQTALPFDHVWSSQAAPSAHFTLNHVDPTVRSFTFKVSAVQGDIGDNKISFSVHVRVPDPGESLHGTVTSLGSSSTASPIRSSRQRKASTPSKAGIIFQHQISS